MENCDPQTKVSLDVMINKKSSKTNLPWPNGKHRGFASKSHRFDPKAPRTNYSGVPLGNVNFLA